MALTDKQKADIRAARNAYMREYRKRAEYQTWQYEYNRRPDVIERREASKERYWLRKAKELQKAD
jgi:hypothetical protein